MKYFSIVKDTKRKQCSVITWDSWGKKRNNPCNQKITMAIKFLSTSSWLPLFTRLSDFSNYPSTLQMFCTNIQDAISIRKRNLHLLMSASKEFTSELPSTWNLSFTSHKLTAAKHSSHLHNQKQLLHVVCQTFGSDHVIVV